MDASQRVVHLETSASVSPRLMSTLGKSDGLTGLTLSVAEARGAARYGCRVWRPARD